MTAFNVVRFRVKPGYEKQFVEAHRKARRAFRGFVGGWLVKTGDLDYCFVGQWKSYRSIVNARPEMIGMLDTLRGMLQDLGGGLGVTDPVSGETVARIVSRAAPVRRAKSAAKPKAMKAKRAARPAAGKTARKTAPKKPVAGRTARRAAR